MTRLGIGASYRYILTVVGRKTGQLHSNPVDAMRHDEGLWLVAGYGPANWVGNARAAGIVTLSRAGRSERYTVHEVTPKEAVPVLRKYIREVRVTRPYFDAGPDADDNAIESELASHPVLNLMPFGNEDG
jgi:deazaflavin-dependent oxidoreductase (nitroreductase family)